MNSPIFNPYFDADQCAGACFSVTRGPFFSYLTLVTLMAAFTFSPEIAVACDNRQVYRGPISSLSVSTE